MQGPGERSLGPFFILVRCSLFFGESRQHPLARGREYLAFLLVVVTYLALTSKPLVGLESGLDKVGHLMAFTALGYTGYLGVPTRTALPFALLAFEVLQLFVPGRSAEWSRRDRYWGRYWPGSVCVPFTTCHGGKVNDCGTSSSIG